MFLHEFTVTSEDHSDANIKTKKAIAEKKLTSANNKNKLVENNDTKIAELKKEIKNMKRMITNPRGRGVASMRKHLNDLQNELNSLNGVTDVSESKKLGTHVKIVKGSHAGKSGYVRQIKRDKIRQLTYLDIDLEDGGEAVELKQNCRIIKAVDEDSWHGEGELWHGTGDAWHGGGSSGGMPMGDLGAMDLAEGEVDTVTVDVPLMIRLLEYAREDAETDMDLHNVAEKLIALCQNGATLSMKDYNKIVGND